MEDPRSPEESGHETLATYRARGGEPTAHPAVEFLSELAGHDRWLARDIILANARIDHTLGLDEAESLMSSIDRWTIELMEDDELADWFLDGLPDEIIRREERYAVQTWDEARRPWTAEVVLQHEPYQCMISGRAGHRLAVRLTRRLDPYHDPILLYPAEILSVIERGLHALEEGLELTEGMSEQRQHRILAQCLAGHRSAPLIDNGYHHDLD